MRLVRLAVVALEELAIFLRRKRAERAARKAKVQRDVAAQKARERAYRTAVEAAADAARRRGRSQR